SRRARDRRGRPADRARARDAARDEALARRPPPPSGVARGIARGTLAGGPFGAGEGGAGLGESGARLTGTAETTEPRNDGTAERRNDGTVRSADERGHCADERGPLLSIDHSSP